MKNLTATAGLFVLVFLLMNSPMLVSAESAPQSGGGGGSFGGLVPIEFVDSERIARWLLLHPVDTCNGIFGFLRDGVEEVNGFFRMLFASGLVTHLEIKGEIIVTEKDKPWTGLPRNNKGEARYFWLWLVCGNEKETVVHGYFQDPLFLENDPIIIDLEFDHIRIEVSRSRLPIPEGTDPSNLFLFVGKSYSGYNQYCDCFSARIDPLETPVFVLKDADGNRIAEGTLDVFEGAVTENIVPVNTKFKGGVREVVFGETSFVSLRIQHFDSTVLRCSASDKLGIIVPLPSDTECEQTAEFPAKVLFVRHLNGSTLFLGIGGISSVEISLIEVFRVAQNGEKIPIKTSPVSGRPFDMFIPSGYEEIFITIIGKTREEIILYVDLSLLNGEKG